MARESLTLSLVNKRGLMNEKSSRQAADRSEKAHGLDAVARLAEELGRLIGRFLAAEAANQAHPPVLQKRETE